MTFILLSVFFNSILFVVLKLFGKYQINTFHALVVNYFTAFLVGNLMGGWMYFPSEVIQKPWFVSSILLGSLFISVFYVTAKTSQINGIAVASVASKMSVVIPILSGVVLFSENLGILAIIGILLALAAVYLTTKKNQGALPVNNQWMYPVLVFVGAGIIDSSLKIIQHHYVTPEEVSIFSISTFLVAGITGLILVAAQTLQGKGSWQGKSLLGGIVLGIPNYFSLYFMIKMLEHPTWKSATIFTVHNVCIVAFTTLLGLLLFKEKLNKANIIGLVLAMISLILVTQ